MLQLLAPKLSILDMILDYNSLKIATLKYSMNLILQIRRKIDLLFFLNFLLLPEWFWGILVKNIVNCCDTLILIFSSFYFSSANNVQCRMVFISLRGKITVILTDPEKGTCLSYPRFIPPVWNGWIQVSFWPLSSKPSQFFKMIFSFHS